ncbi:MAG: sulfate transporter [Hydrogenophilales bacterium CG17_big_fil_post_rev_8_21_14_2_50_63_12]|nr:MAG: sulfate transporter [Hydrogenophilales bacterium CG17_big_fil_post_rev_8_21_14_2_50_63_12]PIX97016.1 MAG: sulfate transporter [Hydrogenophilales bacterium CG_4_10_14_3_um_filter_63_21]PJB02320.1 MAG: sulfate transporter [Hydrogenophilales bacterium CG_4_9_14_3_um_filter_63_34]
MTTENTIPDGYRQDAKGCLVPESMIKPIDRTRDELVRELARQARIVSDGLREFKTRVFADINAFVDLSAEQYDVKLGGKKGNLTLFSFDGAFKVQIAIAEHMVFDERLQAAKHLIDECIIAWSQGSRDEIKVLVQSAFQTDKEGKINTGRVLALRRLDIRDEKWQNAMLAIGESLQVVGSKEYVRFYERIGTSDQYRPISLDVAAV